MAKFPQRIYCANYLRRHKRKIKYQRNFRTVKDLGIDNLRKVLQADRDLEVHESHVLCHNCFSNLKECIRNMEDESSHSSDSFHTTAQVVESINVAICTNISSVATEASQGYKESEKALVRQAKGERNYGCCC